MTSLNKYYNMWLGGRIPEKAWDYLKIIINNNYWKITSLNKYYNMWLGINDIPLSSVMAVMNLVGGGRLHCIYKLGWGVLFAIKQSLKTCFMNRVKNHSYYCKYNYDLTTNYFQWIFSLPGLGCHFGISDAT